MGVEEVVVTNVAAWFWSKLGVKAQGQGKAAKPADSKPAQAEPAEPTTVEVHRDGGKVKVRTCSQTSCQETSLYEFEGSRSETCAARAETTLEQILAGNSLLDGHFRVSEDRDAILYDQNLTVMGSTDLRTKGTLKVIDLKCDQTGVSQKEGKVADFFMGIISSGMLPTGEAAGRQKLDRLMAHTNFFPDSEFFGKDIPINYRDLGLKVLLELATYSFEAGDYDGAKRYAHAIINFKHSSGSARAMNSDEAVFLINDIDRIQALQGWSQEHLDDSISELQQGEARTKPLEGYKARYNYELIRTCATYREQFGAVPSACSEDRVEEYYVNATKTYNYYEPAYEDNFVAVKTMLERARYSLASNTPEGLKRADQEYQKALDTIDYVTDPMGAAVHGDQALRNQTNAPLMSRDERWIGSTLGQAAGLSWFGFKAEMARALRIGAQQVEQKLGGDPSTQFDPKAFWIYQAQALQGKAEVQRRMSGTSSNPTENLAQAQTYLGLALTYASRLKERAISDFYGGGMVEERQTYFGILTDYAEVIVEKHPEEARAKAQEVMRYYESVAKVDHRKDNLGNVNYLKALFVLGTVQERQPHEYFLAASTYNTVVSGILGLAGERGELPPFYLYLQAKATVKTAGVYLRQKVDSQLPGESAQLESFLSAGQAQLATLAAKPGMATLVSQALAESYDIEAQYVLSMADSAQQDEKGPFLDRAKAAVLRLKIAAGQDVYYSNETRIMQARVLLRQADLYETTQRGPDLSGLNWEIANMGIDPNTLALSSSDSAPVILRKTAYQLLAAIPDGMGRLTEISVIERASIAAQNLQSYDLEAHEMELRGTITRLEQGDKTDYSLSQAYLVLTELLIQRSDRTNDTETAERLAIEAHMTLEKILPQHHYLTAQATVVRMDLTVRHPEQYTKDAFLAGLTALDRAESVMQDNPYFKARLALLRGKIYAALAKQEDGDRDLLEKANSYFAAVPEEYPYLRAEAATRLVEIAFTLNTGSKLATKDTEAYIKMLTISQERMRARGVAEDDYLMLTLYNLEANLRIMDDDPDQAIAAADHVLAAVNGPKKKLAYHDYFGMVATLKKGEALFAKSQLVKAEKAMGAASPSLQEAIRLFAGIESQLGEPMPINIYTKMQGLIPEIMERDRFLETGKKDGEGNDVLKAAAAVIRQRYPGQTALANRLQAASIGEAGDAIAVVDEVVPQLATLDHSLPVKTLARRMNWNLPSYKTELYQQMAFAFAFRDHSLNQKSPLTYEYAQSSIEEALNSNSDYDKYVRIPLVKKIIGGKE